MWLFQRSRVHRRALAVQILALLALVTLSAPASAQVTDPPPAPAAEPAQQAGPGLYEDPEGRFSVPVPTNWTAEGKEGYLLLQDPDKFVNMYVVVVPASGAEEAIARGWALIDPGFNLAPGQSVSPPPTPGLDEIRVITYDSGPRRIVQAVAQRVQNQVYLLLFDSSTDAYLRRASQVQIVGSGLTIKALEKTDLTSRQPAALTPEILAELEAYIAESMEASKVPGAEVAIVQNGEVVYSRGFGVREMGKPEPVTPDTLMMIGSTGKTMTTMMMATLVDEGRMDWDTPAVEIYPEFAVADPELSRQITMRNLVCACTGVPRRDLELIFRARGLDAEDVVGSLKGFQFFTGFGEAFQYSNQMVAAGGYIAALAGGSGQQSLYECYLDEMQRRVFDPIGMENTTFRFDEVVADPDHATPHGVNILFEYNPIPLSTEAMLTPIAPAGASWSNVRDLSRYLITEMNQGVSPDGVRAVSAENLMVTWQPQVAISADTSYGLGWMVEEYRGLPLLSHGGNTLGFTSDLAFLPTSGMGIAIIANAQGGNLFTQSVRTRLFELVYDLPMEFDAQYRFALDTVRRRIAELSAGLRDSLDAEAVGPYLSTFTNEALGDISLVLRGGRLFLTTESFTAELRQHVDDEGKVTYLAFDGPVAGIPLEFTEDEAGRPSIILAAPPDNYRFLALGKW